ncbi:hypothetical protein Tco_0666850 [Tanacetum coccineum]
MQTTEEKVDTSNALDASLVDTESSGMESKEQDTSSYSGNDADIRPIYNEEPMGEVQMITEINVFATGQQHTEQPEFNNKGEVHQNAEQCHDKCPLLAKLTDNQRTELSYQSLESKNISLKEGQHGQFLIVKSNEAKVKHHIDIIETINIDLEHKVAKLLKENETLKKHYKNMYDSIKVTRTKTIEHATSLIAKNDEFKAQLQEKGFVIAALKIELSKLKGNSVNTRFAKPSILGKPVLQSLRNQSVVRQLPPSTKSGGRFTPLFLASVSEGLIPSTFLPLLIPSLFGASSNPTTLSHCLRTTGDLGRRVGVASRLGSGDVEKPGGGVISLPFVMPEKNDQDSKGSKSSCDGCWVAKSRITCVNTNGNTMLSEVHGVSLRITSNVRFRRRPPAKGIGLRVADSHTGNHSEDDFTSLETIRRSYSVIRERIPFELEGETFEPERGVCWSVYSSLLPFQLKAPYSFIHMRCVELLQGLKTSWEYSPKRPIIYHRGQEMDFRSFMIQGVDGEFYFLPEGGFEDNQGSFSAKSVNNKTHILDAEHISDVLPANVVDNIIYSSNTSFDDELPPVHPPTSSFPEVGEKSKAAGKRKLVVDAPREGSHRRARRAPIQASKVAGDASTPLDIDSDPDIHEFPSARELKDATDCQWVVAHVTPPSWKQHLRDISIEQHCDIHDRAYMCQAILDNILKSRTRELISALHKARASCDAIQEREVKRDKANYEQPLSLLPTKVEGLESERERLKASEIQMLQEINRLRQDRAAVVSKVVHDAAMKLVHSDEMGVLVARLVRAAIVHGRCTAFKEITKLKEPFVLEKMPGYRMSSKDEYDRAGEDTANASFPFLSEFTSNPYAFMEQLLSIKPRLLRSLKDP